VKRSILALLVILLAVMSGPAQTSKNDDAQQLLALVKEVQAQQTQIADNQAKIAAKLAELAETIRVARIYSSRSR
jgi:outer membrane lipoprotein-sorting protein